MTTKYSNATSVDRGKVSGYNDPYNNLDLNKNQKYLHVTPSHSISNEKNDKRQILKYDERFSNSSDFGDSKARDGSRSWIKFDNKPDLLKCYKDLDKEEEKEKKKSKNYSSASSLIAAYESSNQSNMPSSEENVVITNESKKSGLSTKWKKVKQLFGGKTKELSQDIQNGSSPEISTFSASTKLLQQRRPTSAARGIPFVNAYRRCTRPANERYNPRLTKGQTMKYQPKAAVDPITCVDDKGNFVDYFFYVKGPGNQCWYVDSKMINRGATEMQWMPNMYGHNTAYRRILRQFKERQYEEDVLVIEFNDQFKKADGITTSRKVAHMKGWIMFYGNQGIAVFHSIPCLTCGRENDNIGQQYGQHFFCVTIDRDNLPKLLEQLWTAHPDIGYMNIPEEFINVGRMTDIWNGRFRKNFDQVLKSELQTLGGFEFVIHTRAHSAKQEHQDCPSLWDKIAELYHQSFKVQSWWNNTLLCDKCVRNGFCYTKRGIINILQTIIIGTAADSWEHTRDHTKIGISEGSNILCFGDLNHTVTQLRRGGSIYVFCNPNLVKIFKNTFRYEVEEKSFELNIVFIILSIIVFFLVLIYNYKF